MDRKRSGLVSACESKFGAAVAQIEALGHLTARAGRSLSRAEIYDTSLAEMMEHTGAEGAAVYLVEEGRLILKASMGLPEPLLKDAAAISEESYKDVVGTRGARVYPDLSLHPDSSYSALLRSSGFNSAASAPVEYAGAARGVLTALFRDRGEIDPSVPAFIKGVAANMGVFFGYIDLFHGEYTVKRFLERVFDQLPIGVAVFDRTGVCLFLNNNLKMILGIGSGTEMIGEYRVVEDDVLKGQGMLPSIQKSYEGYTTEFIINYNPALVKRHKLTGSQKRLKIRSIPLYDEGGEISTIALLYEDLSDSEDRDEKTESAV
jgi:PAS domain-containing protein